MAHFSKASGLTGNGRPPDQLDYGFTRRNLHPRDGPNTRRFSSPARSGSGSCTGRRASGKPTADVTETGPQMEPRNDATPVPAYGSLPRDACDLASAREHSLVVVLSSARAAAGLDECFWSGDWRCRGAGRGARCTCYGPCRVSQWSRDGIAEACRRENNGIGLPCMGRLWSVCQAC